MKLDIERVVFIGRTFEEYCDMFQLCDEDIQNKKILDCPAGACSFTAVANARGGDVTACDVVYQFDGEALYEKGLQDVIHTMEHMEKAKDNYIWNYFSSVEDLQKYRLEARYQSCLFKMKNLIWFYQHTFYLCIVIASIMSFMLRRLQNCSALRNKKLEFFHVSI